ncbi:aminoglycoside phosphotransferase family protein [Clostridium sp. FP2]|uniref:aminoglycoside phosphotransferase family protein n=1 Tax=Clostridium sp. FP2 TaxID=2724481 RepID=UPI0013E91E61|nr:aminoglycoside phosphotransferase family protein [Clostridium sp. FP2]MBZ9623776.1 aminoglycoside phosphotransferase family protein [Clostridium sp. FP2]
MNDMQCTIIDETLSYLTKYKVENIKPVIKGYSNDEKYLLQLNNNMSVLMKVSNIKDYNRKKQEFYYLNIQYNNGVKCSKPLEFFILEKSNVCITILTYLEGKSGDEVLPLLPKEIQYSLGYEAANELRKIHEIKPSETFNWYKKRWEKYQLKKKQLFELGCSFYKQDKIENYIEDNFRILRGSCIRFQHDDFQPMNIIINGNELIGIIDFNRFDWGDPIEDFFKLPKYTNEISVQFSKGQIDGYFNCNVPDMFWRKYNLFVALNFHASMIGGHDAYNQLDKVRERQVKIFNTHDFETHGAPEWYLNI